MKTPGQVVVRGEETAYSAVGEAPGTSPKLKDEPATYSQSPIMAAYRNVGKGGFSSTRTTWPTRVTSPEVFENYFWQKDDLTRPDVPQNRSFIFQSVRWAAAPTWKSGTFGGLKTDRDFDPEARLDPEEAGADRLGPIARRAIVCRRRWEHCEGSSAPRARSAAATHDRRVVCRGSSRPDSTSSASPRSSRLLSEGEWDEIKARCRQASDDRFLAMPGIAARDKVGNRWFGCGYVPYPSTDGRHRPTANDSTTPTRSTSSISERDCSDSSTWDAIRTPGSK